MRFSAYAEELKNCKLVFKSVDITKDEHIADKYEVSWSSLIVIDYDKNGEEKVYDEQQYFETIEEAAERVSEIVGCTVEATVNAIQ